MLHDQKYKRPTVMMDDLKAVHRKLRNRILIVAGGILFTLGTAAHIAIWYFQCN